MRIVLAAALAAAAVVLPASTASAAFCVPVTADLCIAPCDPPNWVWDATHVEGPRCTN